MSVIIPSLKTQISGLLKKNLLGFSLSRDSFPAPSKDFVCMLGSLISSICQKCIKEENFLFEMCINWRRIMTS